MIDIKTIDCGNMEVKYFMFEGQRIHVVEDMVAVSGTAIATNTDLAGIYVDKYFMELSEETQNFVLYHELGHDYYNHKYSLKYMIKRDLCSKIGWVIKEEKQADRYAYNKVGKEVALKAIQELKDKFTEILNDLDIKQNTDKILKELDSRYKLFMKY